MHEHGEILGCLNPVTFLDLSQISVCACDGHRFESPQLREEVRTNGGCFHVQGYGHYQTMQAI